MDAKEILLADLEHVRRLLMTNEDEGQVRVSFLLSFVTAVGAGLVALHTSKIATGDATPAWIQDVTLFSLIFLLLMSGVVYLRILHRNRLTDHYIGMADYIFEKLHKLSVQIEKINYSPDWVPEGETTAMKSLRGGYAQMVALIIGVLVVALAVVSIDLAVAISILLGAGVFVVLSTIPSLLRRSHRRS